jgi:hypothetical protein
MTQFSVAFSDRLKETFSSEQIADAESFFRRTNANKAELSSWCDDLAAKLATYETRSFDSQAGLSKELGSAALMPLEMWDNRWRLLAWFVVFTMTSNENIVSGRPPARGKEG